MPKFSQYTITKVSSAGKIIGWNIHKCDEDFNFLESYLITHQEDDLVCNCPASIPNCRHKAMLAKFVKKKAVGKGLFYCYDTDKWTKAKEFK